jgi:hypothetical protein
MFAGCCAYRASPRCNHSSGRHDYQTVLDIGNFRGPVEILRPYGWTALLIVSTVGIVAAPVGTRPDSAVSKGLALFFYFAEIGERALEFVA